MFVSEASKPPAGARAPEILLSEIRNIIKYNLWGWVGESMGNKANSAFNLVELEAEYGNIYLKHKCMY